MSTARKWTRVLAAAAMLAPQAAMAQAQAEGDLAAVLVAHDIVYEGQAWVRHAATGRIVLRSLEGPNGATSLGEWRIEQGARCLRWNRAMDWECYTVTLDGEGGITMTDAFGTAVTGRLVPR